jgi:hypothetical protein
MIFHHYNRFERTLQELDACKDALDTEDCKGASATEQAALNQLISLCKKISDEHGNATIDFDRDEDDDKLLDEEDDEDE